MSENKHTPGPWHWHKSRTMQHLHNDSCSCFAQISMPAATRVDISHVGEYEANARLIAAAPELLAAAERVLSHEAVPLCECGEPDCATTQLRAAIAKAIGR